MMTEKMGILGKPVRVHSLADHDMLVNDEQHDVCDTNVVYCDVYDAFYCPSCDVWLERPCGDSECPYCPGRSDQPSGTHTEGSPVDER